MLAVAACAVLVATHPFRPRLPYGEFQVTVLDVGQGDSLFVSFPNGHTMLIDGGGLAGSEVIRGSRSGADIGEEVVSRIYGRAESSGSTWSHSRTRITIIWMGCTPSSRTSAWASYGSAETKKRRRSSACLQKRERAE